MTFEDARVLRHAFGWLLACVGGAVVLVYVTGIATMQVGPGLDQQDVGYIAGLLDRSVNSEYQLVLLAAWIAVLPHAGVLLWRYPDGKSVDAYVRFASWAQPLFTAFGFLGTIIGVSIAVGGLQGAMDEDDPSGLIEGLSTAFDTTFLGLGAAITLILIQKLAGLRHRTVE